MLSTTFLRSKANLFLLIVLLVSGFNVSNAQYLLNSDSAFKASVPNSGRIWGLTFSDYYFKAHADSSQRGGANQYAGVPQSRSAFQFRRIYLGYDYNIAKNFAAELVLAAEDNFNSGNPVSTGTPAQSGDLLADNKLGFYIKIANVRWKNIWKGTDFVFGQSATPTFALMSEKIWSYRSVEKTITDVHKTSSYDFGAALQGTFDPATKNFGYNVLVANGNGAKHESDNFKWFYGEVYGYFLDKKLVVDLYSDYNRLNWASNWHHSRQMNKLFIAYNSAASAKGGMVPATGYTIGVEGFVNNLKNDNFATKIAGGVDTLSTVASGLSVFVHGDIIKNKLRFFARYDAFNPLNKVDNNKYNKYLGQAGAGYADNTYKSNSNPNGAASIATNDETYKSQFISAGLDFMPAKNIHIMPNIWYASYASQLASPASTSVVANNNDLVFRTTFYYVFGK